MPPAVRDELLQPRKRYRSIDISRIPFAVVQPPSNQQRVQSLLGQIQKGEAEAIALAEELGAKLLIDEMAGRGIALGIGLKVTGVVGVLIESKQKNLIPAVMPLLEQLRKQLGFHLSDRFMSQIRMDVGE